MRGNIKQTPRTQPGVFSDKKMPKLKRNRVQTYFFNVDYRPPSEVDAVVNGGVDCRGVLSDVLDRVILCCTHQVVGSGCGLKQPSQGFALIHAN